MLEKVGEAGVPRILFLQNAPHLLDAYASLPAEVLAIDWRINIEDTQKRYNTHAIQGNIDPAILLQGADPTEQAAKQLINKVNPIGHIVNLGHGSLPKTPLESVEALIDVGHNEKIR